MNALLNAIATGLAHAPALATFTGSDDAKRREGKAPHRTTPEGSSSWGDFSSILTQGNARAATEPSDAHQPHATATAWMRADR